MGDRRVVVVILSPAMLVPEVRRHVRRRREVIHPCGWRRIFYELSNDSAAQTERQRPKWEGICLRDE